MDKETKHRLLYREIRSYFNRLDLRVTNLGETGAQITYVPGDITITSTKHETQLENRIQCLLDIAIALGLQESTKTGERLSN